MGSIARPGPARPARCAPGNHHCILARQEAGLAWVEDRIFAAGGEEIPRHWGEFAGQTGIDSVLHLRPDQPARFPGAALAAFLWLPIASEEQADPNSRWLAGTFVLENLSLGRRVLLHSSLSRHRTRWVFVAYLICSGKPVSAALRAAEARPWLAPYRTQPEAWEAFAAFVRMRQALDLPPVPAR